MVNEITAYECSDCGKIYVEKSEAEKCESTHVTLKNLELTACRFEDDLELDTMLGNIFRLKLPHTLLVDIKGYSGIFGKYELNKVGSYEDFEEYFDHEE